MAKVKQCTKLLEKVGIKHKIKKKSITLNVGFNLLHDNFEIIISSFLHSNNKNPRKLLAYYKIYQNSKLKQSGW